MKKFDNFSSNLKILSTAFKENLSNEFIIGGIINKFTLQFELSWKLSGSGVRPLALAMGI